MSEDILQIQDLVLRFYTYEGIVEALDKINLIVKDGETLGVVGETGCGKSVTALSTLVLVPPPGKIEGGNVLFRTEKGVIDLLKQIDAALRRIRGRDISMIFQDPKSALNPVFSVKEQITEVLLQHRLKEYCKRALKEQKLNNLERKILEKMLKNPKASSLRILSKIPIINRYKNKLKKEAEKDVIKLLEEMRLPDPERVAEMYPHQLSGGMAQRVVIAIALACNPKLLIADEPTTNLDVTIQAQILNLIKELKSQYGSTVQYITHDMGVIAELCDRVAVMYAGSVVEVAEVTELFKNPLHPYTKALLESIPRPGKEFKSIEGIVPSLINPPKGCRFHPRCPYAMDICTINKPKFVDIKKNHFVECHLYSKE
jgi:peptide/nickel transport system ATP-binding protein